MSHTKQYDYIIAGAGCAGLSLLMHMIESDGFADKKILLIDKVEKNRNDRTWCFWETGTSLFEPIVYKKWQKAWFHGHEVSQLLEISPYSYKLIRGIDFYRYSLELASKQHNVDILTGEIKEMISNEKETFIVVNGQQITADFIFNSILPPLPSLKKNEYYLLQHFKGWVIRTAENVFDPDQAVLMDFRVEQSDGTTFVYVMPFSPNEALIEYTLFTHNLLESSQYDQQLKEYIKRFVGDINYTITEEEFGIIPMTNYRFAARSNNIINIGTAGGQTKASSGYTFRFIQKHSAAIVDSLLHKGDPFVERPNGGKRFRFYDSVLLNILHHKTLAGKNIFTDLFKKNKPQQVLKFLDNETSLTEELSIISSLPTLPFLKAAFKQF